MNLTHEEKIRLPRDERRATLLTAALEVFTAVGYHSAAMDEIADQAGVSKPVLYQHFPSKLDLYLAVLEIHCEYLVSDIRTAVASTTDNAGRVLATVNAYFDYINRDGEAFRLLFESDMAVEPQVRERLNKMSYDCAAAFSDAISAETDIPSESAMLLAVGLIGTAQTTARHWLARDGKIDRDLAIKLVASLQWRGISGFRKK